jgi:hypothetical protein
MRDIVAKQLEMLVPEQVLNVSARPCKEVINTQHLMAPREQSLAQVGAYEAGTSCYQHALFQMHKNPPATSAFVLRNSESELPLTAR